MIGAIPWWWSWLLTITGIIGLWAAGSRRSWGWALSIAVQALWIAYAVTTNQPGFVFSALVYGAVYGRNYLLWRRSQ